MGGVIILARAGIRLVTPALPENLVLMAIASSGVASYLIAMWTLDHAFLVQTLRLIRRAVATS